MATAEKLELAEQYVFKNFINEAVDTLKGIGRSLLNIGSSKIMLGVV